MKYERVLVSLLVASLLITTTFISLPVVVRAGFPNYIEGFVANATTGVCAYDPDPAKNGNSVCYIQNERGNGTSSAPMFDYNATGAGWYFWDAGSAIAWESKHATEPAVIVINQENGSDITGDRAGYVAYTTGPWDLSGLYPDCQLQKIPVPVIISNGTDFINVSWSALPDPFGIIAGYTVYRSETNQSDWVLVSGDKDFPVTGPYYWNDTDPALVQGVQYYYSLRVSFIGWEDNKTKPVDNYECQYFGEGSGIMKVVTPPTVDSIKILYQSGGIGPEITDQSIDVGIKMPGYAAAYNKSVYLYDVPVDWSVTNTTSNASTSPIMNSDNSTFYSGFYGGTATWTANYTTGITYTVTFTINPPTEDYIWITYVPNGFQLGGGPVDVGFQEWGYCSAYNNTIGYIGIRSADWTAEPPPSPSLLNGTTATENGIDVGIMAGTVWFNASYGGLLASVQYIVGLETVDYIVIMDAPGNTGNPIYYDYPTYPSFTFYNVGDTDNFWAAGFNSTTGNYVKDVEVTWSTTDAIGNPDTANGTVTAGPATNTTFTANSDHGGALMVRAENATLGVWNFTNILLIIPPQPDWINITESPNGTPLGDRVVDVGFQEWGYCSAYNNTAGYIGIVSANWTAEGNDASLLNGTTSTENGIDVGTKGGTVWLNASFGGLTYSVQYTVNPPTVDWIIITNVPGGSPLGGGVVLGGSQEWGFCSAYNYTVNYIGIRDADWTAEPPSASLLNGTTATENGIDVGGTAGPVWFNTTFGGHAYSVQYTVSLWIIDYINITYTPNGTALPGGTVDVGFQEWGYCSGYNLSGGGGFLGIVAADWTADGGDASLLNGTTATKNGIDVGTKGGTVWFNITYGIYTYSVQYTVNPPTIDWINITEVPDGNAIVGDTVDVGFQEWGYCSAYNNTIGYIGIRSADWTVDGIDPSLLNGTTATENGIDVGTKGGTVWLNATFGGYTYSVQYTVNPPTVDWINITDVPDGNAIVGDTVDVGFQEWGYCSAYNSTIGYLGIMSADWTAQGGDSSLLNVTTATQNGIDVGTKGGTVWLNASYGGSTYSIQYTVNPPTVDYIVITETPGGNALSGGLVLIGFQEWGYCSAYNYTVNYIGIRNADWTAQPPSASLLNGTTATENGIDVGGTAGPVWFNATFGGHAYSVQYTVSLWSIDYIEITYTPNGIALPGGTVDVGFVEWGYCSAYNTSGGDFLGIVPASWTAQGIDNPLLLNGTTATQNGINVGTEGGTVWFNASYSGHMYSVQYTVNPPTVDSIQITDVPDGMPLGGGVVDVGFQEWGYCSAYNNTIDYIGIRSADWTAEGIDPLLLNVTTATQNGIDVGTKGGTVWLNASYGGYFDSVQYTVNPPTVDSIQITDVPDGTPLTGGIVGAGFQEWGYCSAYNNTIDYIGIRNADWTALGGDSSLLNGTTATENGINVGTIGGTIWLNASFGGHIASVQYTVSVEIIDQIIIMDAPDNTGNPVWPNHPYEHYTYYSVGDTDQFWAAGFNSTTGNYIGDVIVTWTPIDIIFLQPDTSNGTAVTGPDIFTTFTANSNHMGALFIKAENATLGVENTTDMLVILPPQPDSIIIRDAPNNGGSPVTTATYGVMETDIFYAAAYNNTADYIGDIAVNWSIDDNTIGSVTNTTIPGAWTNFTALQVASDSQCTITATYDVMGLTVTDSTGLITVLAPLPDYVVIVDAEDNAGSEVMDRTYMVYDEDFFYLAGYNSTLEAHSMDGYVGDYHTYFLTSWICNDTTVGQIQTLYPPPKFYALKITQTKTCNVTATYMGMSDSTGILTVLAATIDYIQIRTSQNGGGFILDTELYTVGDTDDFWAAGYNYTGDYVDDVEVDWAVTGGIGDADPTTGVNTTFTATAGGTGTITADYNGITNSSGTITVIVGEIPPSQPAQPIIDERTKNSVTISWTLNPEPDIAFYIVQRAPAPTGPYTDIYVTPNNSTSTYKDTGLDSGTTYYYRIIAVDQASYASEPSPEVSATTLKPEEKEDLLWLLLLLFIIIVIVILLLILFLWKKKKGEAEVPPTEAAPAVAPPPEEAPPTPYEEEMPEEGMPEEEYIEEEPAAEYEEYGEEEVGGYEEEPSYEETPGEEGTEFEEMSFEEEPSQQPPPPPPGGSEEPTEFGEEETPPEKKKLPPPPPE